MGLALLIVGFVFLLNLVFWTVECLYSFKVEAMIEAARKIEIGDGVTLYEGAVAYLLGGPKPCRGGWWDTTPGTKDVNLLGFPVDETRPVVILAIDTGTMKIRPFADTHLSLWPKCEEELEELLAIMTQAAKDQRAAAGTEQEASAGTEKAEQ